jgi:tRNA modification GTPase
LLETADTGKILKEGLKTIIVGKPNVGKSSLLNALLREQRAIVTDVPGTTRDIIEEYINIKGIPLKIIDTAGIRETEDMVEKIGVERTKELFRQADLLLIVLDASDRFTEEDELLTKLVNDKKAIVLINKTDLPQRLDEDVVRKTFSNKKIIKISVKENIGLDRLKEEIAEMFFKGKIESRDLTIITNLRHKEALRNAKESLEKAMETIELGMPLDCIAIDVTGARNRLGEITGDTVSEDVLDQIFTQFCIGK